MTFEDRLHLTTKIWYLMEVSYLDRCRMSQAVDGEESSPTQTSIRWQHGDLFAYKSPKHITNWCRR